MKWLERWKVKQDRKKAGQIIYLLERFWSPIRRKDFVTATFVEIDFSVEELEELSNLLGQIAHERARKQ